MTLSAWTVWSRAGDLVCSRSTEAEADDIARLDSQWYSVLMRSVGDDEVVIPRAELVALYGDAPVDVPVIRRVLGETK